MSYILSMPGRLRTAALFFLLLLPGLTAGCGPGGLQPDDAAVKFLETWKSEDFYAMYELLDEETRERYSIEDISGRYQNIGGGIGLVSVEYELGEVLEHSGDQARIAFTVILETQTVGKIPIANVIRLNRESRYAPWLVSWGPELIFPELTDSRRVELIRQLPKRGAIFDRHGRILADYRKYREIGIVPGRNPDDGAVLGSLSALLDIPMPALRGRLEQPWVSEGLYVPLTVLTAEQEYLLPQLLEIRGVMVKDVERRFYPAGVNLGHLTGYLGEITAEELEEKRPLGFIAGDLVGKAGLEGVLDLTLGGAAGYTLRVVEDDGTPAALLAKREAQNGAQVTVTIDLDLQQVAVEALAGRPGAVVALDPQNGEVLVLASNPGFDPNRFITGLFAPHWQALAGDPLTPLLNRALEGLYPPGSVFKAYTAAAALQEQGLNPDRMVTIEGDSWQPSPAWGNYRVRRTNDDTRLNLYDAMKYSDNIYFAQIGLEVGAGKFEDFGQHFGFGERVPFVLPVAVSNLSNSGIHADILLADSSFGQGEVLVTPLQMALLYSAFAAGGEIPLPRLLLLPEQEHGPWKTALENATASVMHRALVRAVHGDGALAAAGAVEGFTVAGKTGTAQTGGTPGNICWYVTYGPAENPALVVAAVVEEGRWATEDALPVARAVLEAYLLPGN